MELMMYCMCHILHFAIWINRIMIQKQYCSNYCESKALRCCFLLLLLLFVVLQMIVGCFFYFIHMNCDDSGGFPILSIIHRRTTDNDLIPVHTFLTKNVSVIWGHRESANITWIVHTGGVSMKWSKQTSESSAYALPYYLLFHIVFCTFYATFDVWCCCWWVFVFVVVSNFVWTPMQQHQQQINKLSNNNNNSSSNSCQCYRLMQVTDNSLKSQVYSLPITVYFQQRSLLQNTGNSRISK